MVKISERDIEKCWVNPLARKFVDQNSPQVGYFEFDQVEIFHGISLPETAHFVL